MENIKKNPLSLQLNADDFLPASNEEKQSLVIMRESVNFWKDGLRRLRKNKIAMFSLVVIILIAIFAYVLPSFWPYSYEQQIKGSVCRKAVGHRLFFQPPADCAGHGVAELRRFRVVVILGIRMD